MMQAAFQRAAQRLAELPDSLNIPLLARLASEASRTGSENSPFRSAMPPASVKR